MNESKFSYLNRIYCSTRHASHSSDVLVLRVYRDGQSFCTLRVSRLVLRSGVVVVAVVVLFRSRGPSVACR